MIMMVLLKQLEKYFDEFKKNSVKVIKRYYNKHVYKYRGIKIPK